MADETHDAECGCSIEPLSGGVLIDVDEEVQ